MATWCGLPPGLTRMARMASCLEVSSTGRTPRCSGSQTGPSSQRTRRPPLTPHCSLCRTSTGTPIQYGTESVASFCRLSTMTSAGSGTQLTQPETRGWLRELRLSSVLAVCGEAIPRGVEGSARTENVQEVVPAWARIHETSLGITQ